MAFCVIVADCNLVAVTQFIKDQDHDRRLELIKAMMSDGSVVSASGQTLDDHLGEWA